MDLDILKLVGGSGLAGALLLIIWRVGNAMVGAIDRLGIKVDSHTEKDVEHHGMVRADVAELRGDMRELRAEIGVTREAIARELSWDKTPVFGTPIIHEEKPKRRTPVAGVPTEYSKKRRNDD